MDGKLARFISADQWISVFLSSFAVPVFASKFSKAGPAKGGGIASGLVVCVGMVNGAGAGASA